LDGTHIHVLAAEEEKLVYFNRKKSFSINNLIIVDLDGYVIYIKAGISCLVMFYYLAVIVL
jgi:hypothetical protein